MYTRSNSDVCKSVLLIKGCHEFMKEVKKMADRAISAAMELANDLQVEPGFWSVKRECEMSFSP